MAICQLRQECIWKIFAIFGSCLSSILRYGVPHSAGVYFPIFIDAFGTTREETAWVGSILMACSFSSSPVASLLVNRFGCRVTVILAGLLTVTGLATSSLAQSLYVLYITYGFIAGAGCGLLHITNAVNIVEHFGQNSSIYFGLAAGIGGLGSFIFPPIIRFLEETYGWRGSLLICGGISMHICLAGAMMHPGNKIKKVRTAQVNPVNVADERNHTSLHKSSSAKHDCLDQETNSDVDIGYDANDKLLLASNNGVDDSKHSNTPTTCSTKSSNSDEKGTNTKSTCVCTHGDSVAKNTSWKTRLHLEDISIFKDISYSILCFQQILYCFGVSIIFVHLGAYAEFTLNISKIHSAMLFSTIGVTLLVSKIAWGFLLRIPALQRRAILMYALTLSLAGIPTFFLHKITTYTGLVVYSIIFGLGYCALGGAHLSSALIKIAGVEKLSMAYGFIIFFDGVGFIIGPPVAGWLFDTFQSYQSSFILSGTLVMISCLIMGIPLWRQAENGKNRINIEVLAEG